MSKNWEAKDEDKERARQEFVREQAERDRVQTEERRRLCTALKFPQFCDDARCKRARRCAGDVEACFNRFWPHVPEDVKNEIRHAIKLAAAGASPAEAAREAQAYVAQRRRIDRQLVQRPAAPQAKLDAEAAPATATRTEPPRHAGPRIRAL